MLYTYFFNLLQNTLSIRVPSPGTSGPNCFRPNKNVDFYEKKFLVHVSHVDQSMYVFSKNFLTYSCKWMMCPRFWFWFPYLTIYSFFVFWVLFTFWFGKCLIYMGFCFILSLNFYIKVNILITKIIPLINCPSHWPSPINVHTALCDK